MKKYVISVVSSGVKKYVYIDTNSGKSVGVDDKSKATPFPSRALVSSICKAISPAIRKECLDAKISFELF